MSRASSRAAPIGHAGGVNTIVIECPPSLGLLTVNAIFSADEVVVLVNMTDEARFRTRPIYARTWTFGSLPCGAKDKSILRPRRTVSRRAGNEKDPAMQGLFGVAGAGFEPATFGL